MLPSHLPSILPTEIQQRLDDLSRGLGQQQHAPQLSLPSPGNNAPFNVSQQQQQAAFNSLAGAGSGNNPNSANGAFDVYSQTASSLVPNFHNENDVAQANTFLFNLLMGATANANGGQQPQPQHQLQRSPLLESRPQQHSPLPPAQQLSAPPPLDVNVLAQLGLSGMPGLDPNVLFGSLQLQLQQQQLLATLQQQQQQLQQQQQQQQQLQQQQQQRSGSAGAFGQLYSSLDNSGLLQTPHQDLRCSSEPNTVYSSPATGFGGQQQRPIAQLPGARSTSLGAPPLGMQSLLANSAPVQQQRHPSTAPSPTGSQHSHASSHDSQPSSGSALSEPYSFHSEHNSPHHSTQSYHSDIPSLPSTYQHSFDALARARGPSVVPAGLAPVDLMGRTYRLMEPLSAAAPRESNERGSPARPALTIPTKATEEDEEMTPRLSPSEVAMKRPSSSLLLPAHLTTEAGDPEFKLPSILSTPSSASSFAPDYRRDRSGSPASGASSTASSSTPGSPATVTGGDDHHGTVLPPITSLYPSLLPSSVSSSRPTATADDSLARRVKSLALNEESRSVLVSPSRAIAPGVSLSAEEQREQARRHVELIKGLLVAVNTKWRAAQLEAQQQKEEATVAVTTSSPAPVAA